MNSKLISIAVAGVGLTILGCSTEPEIDWEKLNEPVLVTCTLLTSHRDQGVIIQELRPLVGYAFAAEDDRDYGMPGATVTVTDGHNVYEFADRNNGSYFWEGDSCWVKRGETYELNITLADGRFIHGETSIPNILFYQTSDTVWIRPDSAIFNEEEGYLTQVFNDSSFGHTIRYAVVPEEAVRVEPSGLFPWYNPLSDSLLLWYTSKVTDTTVTFYTASPSPARVMKEYDENNPVRIYAYFGARDVKTEEFERLQHDDDWPVEDLAKVSNIEGAYGFFTHSNVIVEQIYTVAIKR